MHLIMPTYSYTVMNNAACKYHDNTFPLHLKHDYLFLVHMDAVMTMQDVSINDVTITIAP